MFNSWTFFYLVVDKLSGSQHHQASGPPGLRSTCLWAADSSLLPPGEGFSIWKTAQRWCCVHPLRGTRTLPWDYTIVSWVLLHCLCIISLPWLASVWNSPLELREGYGTWMKPISCKQEMGSTERLLCPGACSLSVLQRWNFRIGQSRQLSYI